MTYCTTSNALPYVYKCYTVALLTSTHPDIGYVLNSLPYTNTDLSYIRYSMASVFQIKEPCLLASFNYFPSFFPFFLYIFSRFFFSFFSKPRLTQGSTLLFYQNKLPLTMLSFTPFARLLCGFPLYFAYLFEYQSTVHRTVICIVNHTPVKTC